jgi:hypothetical protein
MGYEIERNGGFFQSICGTRVSALFLDLSVPLSHTNCPASTDQSVLQSASLCSSCLAREDFYCSSGTFRLEYPFPSLFVMERLYLGSLAMRAQQGPLILIDDEFRCEVVSS